jgi:spectinomycin phosphotransferase
VREYVASSDETLLGMPATAPDDAAIALHAFLRERRAAILNLVAQAEQLANVVQQLPQELVLCHADIHVGNVLIGASGEFYVVDWDTVTLAPKERDLMFIGGGIAGVSKEPREAELFYSGYGPCTIDTRLLAYYRFERIVQDIAAYSMQVLASTDGEERAGFLREVASQFDPGNVVEIAWRTLPGVAAG